MVNGTTKNFKRKFKKKKLVVKVNTKVFPLFMFNGNKNGNKNSRLYLILDFPCI